MSDDKKQEKKDDDKNDQDVIKIRTSTEIDGSIGSAPLFVGTDYKNTFDITGRAYREAAVFSNDYLDGRISISTSGDIGKHIFTGTQPLTLATQAGILGVNALGENLLDMKIKTISDARNFMVGVNNVASVFSENSGLLKSIESASAVALNHSKFMTEAMDRLNTPSITRGIELATEYHIKANEVFKLSKSVTTVLAYGQAVQNKFSILTGSEMFKNGATALRDSSTTLGKISDHIPTYIGSEAITSPFVFEPRTVKTKEVERALPEVKKELPIKTTEAIELMEYVFDPSTKNDDKRIITTVSELKRAIKNMQGSVAMFIQQTTHKVEVTAMPTLQVNIEKSTSSTNKFPFKIPAGTTWQNIVIQFINSDTVNIQVAGRSHQTGYADMGFVDKRTSKPTIQWGLLLVLAKNGGLLSATSGDARDKYKKHKQLLSDKLKDYFDIEPDPFEPYKGGYKTKITLAPPPSEQNKIEDTYSTTDEVEDMFRDLTEE